MPWERSTSASTASVAVGAVKLGQPVPESNLASDENSSAPQPAQVYMASACASQNAPVKARSVPWRRSTSYCSGVSDARHSASVLSIFILSVLSTAAALYCRDVAADRVL